VKAALQGAGPVARGRKRDRPGGATAQAKGCVRACVGTFWTSLHGSAATMKEASIVAFALYLDARFSAAVAWP